MACSRLAWATEGGFQASLGYRRRLEYPNPRLTTWLSRERCLPPRLMPRV